MLSLLDIALNNLEKAHHLSSRESILKNFVHYHRDKMDKDPEKMGDKSKFYIYKNGLIKVYPTNKSKDEFVKVLEQLKSIEDEIRRHFSNGAQGKPLHIYLPIQYYGFAKAFRGSSENDFVSLLDIRVVPGKIFLNVMYPGYYNDDKKFSFLADAFENEMGISKEFITTNVDLLNIHKNGKMDPYLMIVAAKLLAQTKDGGLPNYVLDSLFNVDEKQKQFLEKSQIGSTVKSTLTSSQGQMIHLRDDTVWTTSWKIDEKNLKFAKGSNPKPAVKNNASEPAAKKLLDTSSSMNTTSQTKLVTSDIVVVVDTKNKSEDQYDIIKFHADINETLKETEKLMNEHKEKVNEMDPADEAAKIKEAKLVVLTKIRDAINEHKELLTGNDVLTIIEVAKKDNELYSKGKHSAGLFSGTNRTKNLVDQFMNHANKYNDYLKFQPGKTP